MEGIPPWLRMRTRSRSGTSADVSGCRCRVLALPPQQVGSATHELPGTGTREDESPVPVLDEGMHFVEQGGQLLDLIDDHRPRRGGAGRQFLAQEARAGGQTVEHVESQEVVERSAGE